MAQRHGTGPGPIAVIGGGVMGEVIARAALATRPAGAVRVAEKNEQRAGQLHAELGVEATGSLAAATSGASAVVIAVKPPDVPALLSELAPLLSPDVVVITVAVGLSAASYEEALAPGTPVVRVMPNTPAIVGAGVAAISPGRHAGEDALALAEELLAPTGMVVRVPEKQQDAVAAISGSGPAYAFYLIDALAEAGVRHGLPRELAIRLAAGTLAGAGIMARDTGEHPVILRERVSSPGGTTVVALAELDRGGTRAAVMAAVGAAVERAQQIAAG